MREITNAVEPTWKKNFEKSKGRIPTGIELGPKNVIGDAPVIRDGETIGWVSKHSWFWGYGLPGSKEYLWYNCISRKEAIAELIAHVDGVAATK